MSFPYFKSSSDYDTDDFADATIRMNHNYCYVSNSLLNGFVNYSRPVACALLERYSWHSEERMQAMLKKPHTTFGLYRDDVVLLLKSENGTWSVLWYDQDSSDCSIGFFRTDDSRDRIVDEFTGWLREKLVVPYEGKREGEKTDSDITDVRFIGVQHIGGWMSS